MKNVRDILVRESSQCVKGTPSIISTPRDSRKSRMVETVEHMQGLP